MSSITLRIANETPRGESLARHLRDAHGFVEIALAACAAAREQELDCTLSMLSSQGDPMIVVEPSSRSEDVPYSMPISALTARIGVIRWSSEQPIGERTSQLVGMGIHVAGAARTARSRVVSRRRATHTAAGRDRTPGGPRLHERRDRRAARRVREHDQEAHRRGVQAPQHLEPHRARAAVPAARDRRSRACGNQLRRRLPDRANRTRCQ